MDKITITFEIPEHDKKSFIRWLYRTGVRQYTVYMQPGLDSDGYSGFEAELRETAPDEYLLQRLS